MAAARESGTGEASLPAGTVDVALAHAQRLLPGSPSAAAAQASEVLKVVPTHPGARLILGSAQGLLGQGAAAVATLSALAREQPRSAVVHFELGIALANAGDAPHAANALRKAAALKPTWPEAWRKLADCLDLLGDEDGSDAACAHFIEAATRDPRLLATPPRRWSPTTFRAPRSCLRAHVKPYPATMSRRCACWPRSRAPAPLPGGPDTARALPAARAELRCRAPQLRHRPQPPGKGRRRPAARWTSCSPRMPRQPGLPQPQGRGAREPRRVRRVIAALYAAVLKEFPQPAEHLDELWALAEDQRPGCADGIAAYRRAICLEPPLGEAWWSLANLKTLRFEPSDLRAMRSGARAPGSERGGSAAFRVRARQGARGRASCRANRSRTTRPATRCAASSVPTALMNHRPSSSAAKRTLHAGVLRQPAPEHGAHGARSDLRRSGCRGQARR